MSLAQPTWRYVGSSVPAANTNAGVLDALYTLGTATTYADGTTRTPGSGVAGTFNRYQNSGTTETIYATTVSNTHSVEHIWAGQASGGTKTPTMGGPDSSATATVMYGLSRGSTTFNAWDNATPFTGGTFTGYLRCCALGTFTIAKVHLFECSVGFIVIFATSSGITHTIGGELVDPGVTNATSPSCAEATTNGRYFIHVNGGTSATSTTSWTDSVGSTSAALFAHSTSANTSNHCYVLSVGGVTLTAVERHFTALQTSTSSTFVNADGDAVFAQAIHLVADGGGTYYGALRGMCLGRDAKLGNKATQSGTTIALCVSTHPSTDNDSLWLTY